MHENYEYNKHYIRVNQESHIIYGFSNAFERPHFTDILINDMGSYQFQLFQGGEENPQLRDEEGIFLYKWDSFNLQVLRRTEEELQLERDKLKPIFQAANVRAHRDILLAKTDRTQIPDFPISDAQRKKFITYRQKLRDIPLQPGFPFEVVWPEPPIVI